MGLIPYSPLAGGLLAGALEKVTEGRRSQDYMQGRDRAGARRSSSDGSSLCKELGERPADVALAWLLHQPAVTAPIIGPRTEEQLLGSMRALQIRSVRRRARGARPDLPGPGRRRRPRPTPGSSAPEQRLDLPRRLHDGRPVPLRLLTRQPGLRSADRDRREQLIVRTEDRARSPTRRRALARRSCRPSRGAAWSRAPVAMSADVLRRRDRTPREEDLARRALVERQEAPISHDRAELVVRFDGVDADAPVAVADVELRATRLSTRARRSRAGRASWRSGSSRIAVVASASSRGPSA